MLYRKRYDSFFVQMHFIQGKQFNEAHVTSCACLDISHLNIFPECFRGPLKTLWWATCGPLACSWTTLTWLIKVGQKLFVVK